MMDDNVPNEAHPEPVNVGSGLEEGESNVEMTPNQDSVKTDEPSSVSNSAPASLKLDKPSKITVVLCPVGGAPIMRQRKWEVDSTQTVGFISSFIRKKLALQKSDSLFFYVSQSFAPALDQSVQNLFDCFGSDGKLILSYCKTQAWG